MSDEDPTTRVLKVGAVLGGILMLAVVSVAIDQGGSSAPRQEPVVEETEQSTAAPTHREPHAEQPRPRQERPAGYTLIGWKSGWGGMSAKHLGVFATEAECNAALHRTDTSKYSDVFCSHVG